ncbi:MBL fold metallo-hydrolase [Sphingomonas sp. CL5.1]|uniref:MBL fold metallo-hydrolase n=1 Tax=Sphingomonas sp. CL5.1 TaxID=2653203 RepID=UPI00158187A8|nr:MBL fold metallo-hydrolase [Sphingomonas sp. CL5.1]QKR99800.1 MBL fold metallo-hydrolase [Sphingomonas sp. CL5.1]
MAVRQLTDDVWLIPGLVNVYVLRTEDGLAVLDTGFPGHAGKILKALRTIGKTAGDVRHIVLTHCHPDHIGSAAALRRETGAIVWAHPIDAPMIEAGTTMRAPMTPSPGLRNLILAKLLSGRVRQVEPTRVDRLLADGESPSFASDMTAIHVPGHCAGQIALLWRRDGGILFTADACVNRRGLTLAVATEDPALALVSLARLADLDFDKVCVMHGPPILRDGAAQFRRTNFDTFRKRRA